MKKTNVNSVSFDVSAAIRKACYGNLSEFYRRNASQLGMSHITFHRAIAGEHVSDLTIQNITNLCTSLGLLGASSNGASAIVALRGMIPILDKVTTNFSAESYSQLVDYYAAYRRYLANI